MIAISTRLQNWKNKHTHTTPELVILFPKGGEAMLANSHFVLKATSNKGSTTKSLGTNLKQIELWIQHFFTFIFSKILEAQWLYLKAWVQFEGAL